ncbi:hypothetical protein, partial [Rossellomorea marisflavi]|uniref:HD domain-containing protein n=1 Tax=Rossellomorea marisflavi TaxID=189381 RepID=UPI0018CF66B3
MEKLIPDLDKINEFEVILLCYAALLHDIGMAASEEEINSIKDHSLSYGEIDYEAVLKKFNGEHIEATQEYIRKVHAIRSAEFIRKELKGYLYMPSMPNTTFEDQLSIICQSHTEDIGWINKNLKMKSQKAEYEFNPRFCSLVLRLADILDFDSQRTPPSLLKSVSPEGISKDEWEQHFSIENVNKIKNGDYGFKLIELHGRCDNPSIHRKILSYIDWINNELENAVDVSQTFPRHYKLLIHSRVHNYIDSEGYTIADMKFKINYNEITKLLMGDNLYGDKKYGLRELIQNSIDACKLKKEIL